MLRTPQHSHFREGKRDSQGFFDVAHIANSIDSSANHAGRLCCPTDGKNIGLDLTNPSWDVADYKDHVVFNWTVK
jgi:hypothetical protein